MAQREYMRSPTVARREAAVIDRGLQGYMSKVYALMTGAMILTGLVAYVVGMDFRAVVNQEPTTVFPPR
jgi:FtsH-binding integral membrane protein